MATEQRRPLHLVWLVGLSASLYAANLAAVTALQAASDRQAAAAQVPAQDALDALQAHDARVAQEIVQATANLQAGSAIYSKAGTTLSSLEQRLAGLTKSAGALRALPAVPVISGGSVAVPAVHATTGASGAKP